MAQIIKRGKMWYSDFRQDGKRIRRALSPYKPKADELLTDLLQLRKADKDGTQPKEVSWFFFEEKYLRYRKSEFKPGTYDKDALAFRIIKQYGRPLLRLRQMTPEYLIDLGIRAKEKGISECTLSGYMRQIKTAMRTAEEWGLIPSQLWRRIKCSPDGKRVEYFDYDQLQNVLSLENGHWKTAAMLMAYAGLRSGEARNMEFADLDFEHHILHVRVKEDWRPKGSRGQNLKERTVGMIEDLEFYLKGLPDKTGYVLGSFISKNVYRNHFIELTKKAGFKVFAHKFRHTYASMMISAGVTLDRLSPLMGHSSRRSTEIYAHLLPHTTQESTDLFQASLRQHMPPPDLRIIA